MERKSKIPQNQREWMKIFKYLKLKTDKGILGLHHQRVTNANLNSSRYKRKLAVRMAVEFFVNQYFGNLLYFFHRGYFKWFFQRYVKPPMEERLPHSCFIANSAIIHHS